MTVEPLCYRVSEALTALGMKKSKFYEEVKAGRLVARKRGGETVVLVEDARAYLAALPAIGVAA